MGRGTAGGCGAKPAPLAPARRGEIPPCPGLSPGVIPGPCTELPGPAAPQFLCPLSGELAAGARAQLRGEGTEAPSPAQSLHSLGLCWRCPRRSGRSVPQDPGTLVPVPASGTPGRRQRCLRRAIFSPRHTGSAAAARPADPGQKLGHRAAPLPQSPSRHRCQLPGPVTLHRARRAGQPLAASAGTPRPAGITPARQHHPPPTGIAPQGPSSAPAPGEGIGSLHAVVPGASTPWDPRKGTGRVAAGQRDAGHTPWHRELRGERGGRAAHNPLSPSGAERRAAGRSEQPRSASRCVSHPPVSTALPRPRPAPGSPAGHGELHLGARHAAGRRLQRSRSRHPRPGAADAPRRLLPRRRGGAPGGGHGTGTARHRHGTARHRHGSAHLEHDGPSLPAAESPPRAPGVSAPRARLHRNVPPAIPSHGQRGLSPHPAPPGASSRVRLGVISVPTLAKSGPGYL